VTIKKAQELVQSVNTDEMEKIEKREDIKETNTEKKEKTTYRDLEGYKWKEEVVNYGGVKQIWLNVSKKLGLTHCTNESSCVST
jgi:hypothetical protein